MTLAQQRKTFGTNHRGLKIIGAMTAGVVLTASATFGALTLQSQSNIEAVRPTQTSITQEWSAPRVLVSNAGTVVRSPEIDVLSAARIGGGKTYDAARIQTQEQTLRAERIPVGLVATSLRTGPTLEQAAAMDEALFAGSGVFDNLVRTSVRTGPTLEQAAAMDEAAFQGGGVFDNPVTVSRSTGPTLEQAAAMDQALFEGAGIFDSWTPAATASIGGTSVLSDEQTYVAELEYRSANGIGVNSVSTASTPLTPELSAGTHDQVSGHRVGGGLSTWQSSEEDAMSAGRLQVR